MPTVGPSARLEPRDRIRWYIATVLALAVTATSLAVGPYVLGYATGAVVVLLCFIGFVPAYNYVRSTAKVPEYTGSDESIDFVLTELRAKMAAQIERKRILENKAGVFTGIVVILTSLTLYRIQVAGWNPLTQHGALALLFFTALLATIISALAAVWPRQINEPPDPDRIAADIAKPLQVLRINMVYSLQEAYPENEKAISCVLGFVRCTAVLLVLDLVLAAAVLSSAVPQYPTN